MSEDKSEEIAAGKAAKAEAAKVAKAQKAEDAKIAKAKKAEDAKVAKAKAAVEREAVKAAKAAEREANRMPEQNGIRRPKPDGKCGQAWEIFDNVSGKKGSAAAISECMIHAAKKNLNVSNVRAEYARWRKFHGITGRVAAKESAKETA